jgi:hypothetical protein
VNTVFDLFEEVPYEFLKVSRGGVYGNRITGVYTAYGVFKRRNNKIQTNNQELRQSASTLHIHPDEPFIADITIDGKILFVGNGVRVGGVDYEIESDTGGQNFDTGELEHYTLALQVTDYSDFSEGS